MKKHVSLLLAVILILLTVLSTASCAGIGPTPPTDDPGQGSGSGEFGDDPADENPWLIFPTREYPDRETIAFTDFSYTSPDFSAEIAAFDRVTALISEGKVPYSEMRDAIFDLEPGYTELRDMMNYADLMVKRNAADSFYGAEVAKNAERYPDFSQAIENLFVACALSPFCDSFEADYFGEGSLLEYKNGGIIDDEMVALLRKEGELETAYETISESTVLITYRGQVATPEELIARYAQAYGEKSSYYQTCVNEIRSIYAATAQKRELALLVDLIRVRRQIADKRGVEDYSDLAYEGFGRTYSKEDARAFFAAVRDYVIPVLTDMRLQTAFAMQKEPDVTVTPKALYETLGSLFAKDPFFENIYAYMGQYRLCDVAEGTPDRYVGAFTTYFDSVDSPYLFVSTSGSVTDYANMAHEFGHFCDGFVNYGMSDSLDLCEVYSQSLELLTVNAIGSVTSDEIERFLCNNEMRSMLEVLIVQGFYATFEDMVYQLPVDEISEASVNRVAREAASLYGLSVVTDARYCLIPHILLYPFYVQSYCVSALAALEVFFAERANEGAGVEIFKTIVNRDGEDGDFPALLIRAGLSDPLDSETVRSVADAIYCLIIGKHFFTVSSSAKDAA